MVNNLGYKIYDVRFSWASGKSIPSIDPSFEEMLALRSFNEVVEPTVGLEPTTYGLQNRCSTR
jgi:hypothetical protein